MGDIGKPRRKVEFVPMPTTEPVREPASPDPVPVPAPSEPVPA